MPSTAEKQIDEMLSVETPEGVILELRPAGLFVRALAWTLDALVRWTIGGVLFAMLSVLGSVGIGIGLILLFALEWFYPVIFEIRNQGKTPGKHWMGIRVVNDDGTPVAWSQSAVRNLLRTADFFPALYAGGLCCMACDRYFRRMGDLAAGTLVVHDPVKPEQAPATGLEPTAAPIPLSVQEQALIASFANRASQLSQARLAELGDIAAPITGTTGEASAQRLRQIAQWHMGSR